MYTLFAYLYKNTWWIASKSTDGVYSVCL